jgi:hypothetical protein
VVAQLLPPPFLLNPKIITMDSTTLCNLALSKIGDQSITSLDDNTLEARFCKLFYPVVLSECLMLNTWNFATKLANLSQLSGAPLFDWSYAYQLPEDFNRITKFNTFETSDRISNYEINGNTLLTDDDHASIAYISNNPDPSTFTSTFVSIMSLKLASDLAKPVAGSLDLKSQLLQQFERSVAEAGRIDANSTRPRKIEPWVNSPLVNSRFSGVLV